MAPLRHHAAVPSNLSKNIGDIESGNRGVCASIRRADLVIFFAGCELRLRCRCIVRVSCGRAVVRGEQPLQHETTMLDTVTIISRAGLVLYHQDLQASRLLGSNDDTTTTTTTTGEMSAQSLEVVNTFLSTTLLDHNRYAKLRKAMRTAVSSSSGGPSAVVEWEEMSSIVPPPSSSSSSAAKSDGDGDGVANADIKRDWVAIVTYPEVLARGGGGGGGSGGGSSGAHQAQWIRHFLRSVLREYGLFYDVVLASALESSANDNEAAASVAMNRHLFVPSTDAAAKFDPTCRALLRRSENLGRRVGGGGKGENVPASFAEGCDVDDGGDDEGSADEQHSDEADDTATDGDDSNAVDARARAKAVMRNRQKGGRGGTTTNHESRAAAASAANKKGGKEERVWHDGKGKMTKAALKTLDRSKGLGAGEVNGIDSAIAEDSVALAEARAAYLPSASEAPAWEEEDILVDDYDDDADDGSSSNSGWGSSLKGLFDQMSGNKVLTKDDLEAPLEEMKRMLTSKNVANEVAAEICSRVRDRLVGKKMNSFGRVKMAVRHALEAAIEKILRPTHGKDVDVLHSVVAKRERGSGGLSALFAGGSKASSNNRPYTIVMIGINGVGKSTSLAKIAYYLKANGCSPLLAACDTFRSGAVEQLSVHAKCLDLPLYHKGYAKDPSAVAKAAINHATEEGNDVVLVDTAGRMQNNVPLMKALSKLVVENEPDLVLFVCEALVGNDGIDQLQMFDRALRTGGHSRQIDGVVLTKFDTVSDKVGAALTMTHITGAPVAFIGTGQKYNHLKKLSVQSVIKSLFS